ncbi:MAG: PAS domain-containing protein [Rhodospirillaceae bacterium]
MSFVKAVRSPFELFKARTSAEPKVDEPGADWSPDCFDFRDYWSSLRGDGVCTTSDAFLDSPSPRFAGHVFIIEFLDGAPVVRLQGTRLEQTWSRDLTGGDFFPGRSHRFRAAGIANLTSVLSHPCGHLARSSYATSTGRKLTSDWIFLPLAVRQERAPRVVGAVFQQGGRGNYSDVGIHHFELHKLEWLDIGHGVPSAPPAALAD